MQRLPFIMIVLIALWRMWLETTVALASTTPATGPMPEPGMIPPKLVCVQWGRVVSTQFIEVDGRTMALTIDRPVCTREEPVS